MPVPARRRAWPRLDSIGPVDSVGPGPTDSVGPGPGPADSEADSESRGGGLLCRRSIEQLDLKFRLLLATGALAASRRAQAHHEHDGLLHSGRLAAALASTVTAGMVTNLNFKLKPDACQ